MQFYSLDSDDWVGENKKRIISSDMIAIFHVHACVSWGINEQFVFSFFIHKTGVPSAAALYPPAMQAYPFYQPIIQPMVNIWLYPKL
jgi:hypothetical protein